MGCGKNRFVGSDCDRHRPNAASHGKNHSANDPNEAAIVIKVHFCLAPVTEHVGIRLARSS